MIMQFLFFLVRLLFIRLMKIRRKSSQSSFFVNLSSTIKSTVEGLESSYFPVRRVGPGYFGKISPKVMKISVHVKITQMAYNGFVYEK
jgi:hypothetical protein